MAGSRPAPPPHASPSWAILLIGVVLAGLILFVSLSAVTGGRTDLRSRAAGFAELSAQTDALQLLAEQYLESVEEVDASRGAVRERGEEAALADESRVFSSVAANVAYRKELLTAVRARLAQATPMMFPQQQSAIAARITEQEEFVRKLEQELSQPRSSSELKQYFLTMTQLNRLPSVAEPRIRLEINLAILERTQAFLSRRLEQAEQEFRLAGDDDGTVYEHTQVLLEQSRIFKHDIDRSMTELHARLDTLTPALYATDPDGALALISGLQAELSDIRLKMKTVYRTLKQIQAQRQVLPGKTDR